MPPLWHVLLGALLILPASQHGGPGVHAGPLWGGENGVDLTFGIVGAGISGAASALYLREEFPNATIVVFEKDAVGGRVRTDEFADIRNVEMGATSWMKQHRLINDLVERLGIETRNPLSGDTPVARGPFAIWNGRSVVFKQRDTTFWMVVAMMWRYGLSPLYLQRGVADVEARFNEIYNLLSDPDTHTPWEKHETLLRHTGLYDEAQKSLRAHLRDGGFTAAFIDEIVEGVIRNNFGQSVSDVNALAGMLAMRGGAENIVSAKDGNVNIVSRTLQESGAIVLNKTRVLSIQPNHARVSPKALKIRYDKNYAETVIDMDAIIIAAPLDLAEIEITTERNVRYRAEALRYCLTHVTLVLASALSPHYFKILNSETDPTLILTTEEDLAVFSSLGITADAGGGHSVYKVLSREALTEEFLDDVFINRTDLLRHTWHSYPSLRPVPRYPPVRLTQRVYYPSGVEVAAPLLETALISARNAINLLVRDRKSWKREVVLEPQEPEEGAPAGVPGSGAAGAAEAPDIDADGGGGGSGDGDGAADPGWQHTWGKWLDIDLTAVGGSLFPGVDGDTSDTPAGGSDTQSEGMPPEGGSAGAAAPGAEPGMPSGGGSDPAGAGGDGAVPADGEGVESSGDPPQEWASWLMGSLPSWGGADGAGDEAGGVGGPQGEGGGGVPPSAAGGAPAASGGGGVDAAEAGVGAGSAAADAPAEGGPEADGAEAEGTAYAFWRDWWL